MGLAEVRRQGESILERTGPYVFYSFGTVQGYGGVGFLIKKSRKKHILAFKGITNRICMLQLKTDTNHVLSLIQVYVYAPTSDSSDEEADSFYSELNSVLDGLKGKKIAMGDFNSKIGQRQIEEHPFVGPYGIGTRNPRGYKLLRFCQSSYLSIMNTYFKKGFNKK